MPPRDALSKGHHTVTNSKDNPNQYNVPGLERGLAVLRQFTRETPELSAPEIIARLGLPRSTVFRLLQTLENFGYLVCTRDGHRYRLGVAVLRMGFEYLASQSVVELGRPLIETLSLQAGLPAHLVILDGRSVIYAASARPRSALVGMVSVGTRLPAHATVFGRVLLAGRSLDELRQLFPESHLPHTTGQTPDDVAALHALVDADCKRGFGISEGFYEPGISTIAVPIRDESDQVMAAVGLTVTGPRVDRSLIEHGVVEMTIDTARNISENLGYRGNVYAQAHDNALALRDRAVEEVS